MAGAAACAAPAVSGQRGSTVVRSFAAGGLCLCAAVAQRRAGLRPRADAGAVWGAGVFALRLGGLHAARLPGQHLPGTVPRFLCGHGGHGPAGRVLHCETKAAVALAAGGGRGAGLCLSRSRGRGDVPAALCRGGDHHRAGGAGWQAPVALLRGAGYPVCRAGGGGADLLRAELQPLRRVCPVGFFRRLLCCRHGRDDAGGYRQRRALLVGACRCPRQNLRSRARAGTPGLLAGGGRPDGERLPRPRPERLPRGQLLLGYPPRRPV